MNLDKIEALNIVKKYVQNPGLIKHMMAVGAGMRAYAKHFGEDEEKWEIVGILHDFDWEIHPDKERHPLEGSKILRKLGVSEEIIRAILSHADYTGVERISMMEKTLFAVDELTGLITACALVRPNKKLAEVDVDSVKGKWNKKGFAAGVNRADIESGARDLGVELDDHIAFVLASMQKKSDELGL